MNKKFSESIQKSNLSLSCLEAVKKIPHIWDKEFSRMSYGEKKEFFSFLEEHQSEIFADEGISLKGSLVHNIFLDREAILRESR